MTYFEVQPHASYDKSIQVKGPGDLLLEVDYDDVFHDEVDLYLEKMVDVLNRHWEDG